MVVQPWPASGGAGAVERGAALSLAGLSVLLVSPGLAPYPLDVGLARYPPFLRAPEPVHGLPPEPDLPDLGHVAVLAAYRLGGVYAGSGYPCCGP